MLHLVRTIPANVDPQLRRVVLCADRQMLAKRLWRGVAEDGVEFGFELEKPLRHGVVFFQTDAACYVVEQAMEAVVEISLAIAPSAAAGIGWAVGNLHLELQAEADRLIAVDEPAVRALLERLKVPFTATTAVFRPGRFARGAAVAAQELGPSHKH